MGDFDPMPVHIHVCYLFVYRNASFSGLASVYQDLHFDSSDRERFSVWEERLTEGWFLYSALGMK